MPLMTTQHKRHAKLVKHDVTEELLLQLGVLTWENCKFHSRKAAGCGCLWGSGGDEPSSLQDVWAGSLLPFYYSRQAPEWQQCDRNLRRLPCLPGPLSQTSE